MVGGSRGSSFRRLLVKQITWGTCILVYALVSASLQENTAESKLSKSVSNIHFYFNFFCNGILFD